MAEANYTKHLVVLSTTIFTQWQDTEYHILFDNISREDTRKDTRNSFFLRGDTRNSVWVRFYVLTYRCVASRSKDHVAATSTIFFGSLMKRLVPFSFYNQTLSSSIKWVPRKICVIIFVFIFFLFKRIKRVFDSKDFRKIFCENSNPYYSIRSSSNNHIFSGYNLLSPFLNIRCFSFVKQMDLYIF
jgi:hypothetical protein